MATTEFSRRTQLLGPLQTLLWLGRQLISFEFFFLFFLYGIQIREILPRIPGNEVFVFGAITMVLGGWIILRDGIYLRGVPIFMAGLAFVAWLLMSVGWTPSRILVWQNLRFLLTVDLWALFASACIIASSRERIVRLLCMIMVLALVVSAYGIYIELVYGSFRFFRYYGAGESWGKSIYIVWGYIAANGIIVTLAIAIYSRLASLKQLLALAAFGICIYFLLLAGGRGPLLAILSAGLVAVLVQAPRIGNGRLEISQVQLVTLGIIGLGIAYVAYLFSTGETTATLGRFLSLLEEADDPLLRSGANRFDYFAAAYRLWLESPVIGHGLASFAPLFAGGAEIQGTYPHNAILQILAEFGAVGGLLFVILLFTALRNFSLKRLQQDPLALVVMMMFVTFAVQTMVAGDITMNYRFFFILGLLAMRPLATDDDEEEDEELPKERTTGIR